jgi:hypothetical protein
MPYPTRTRSAQMSRTMVRSDVEGKIAGSCLLGVFIVFIEDVTALGLLIRQTCVGLSGVSIDKVELEIYSAQPAFRNVRL